MLPVFISQGCRIVGLFSAVSLAISPWLVAVNMSDPFLNQSWLAFGLAFLVLSGVCCLLPFYRPRDRNLPIFSGVCIFWVGVAISSLFSSYYCTIRQTLLVGSQLVLLVFMILSLKKRDAYPLSLLLIFSGTGMGILVFLQHAGIDWLKWENYSVVGTLANPNFLGAYLMGSALLTLEMMAFLKERPWLRVFLFSCLGIQLGGVFFAGAKGAWVGLAFGLFLAAYERLRSLPQAPKRRKALVAGVLIGIFFICLYGGLHRAIWNFPWNQLARPPFGYFSEVTRLLMHGMGFSLFLQSPYVGYGLGSTGYLLSEFRPEKATSLGLAGYNNDPHSLVVMLLCETGIVGFLGFMVLLAAIWGVHRWRRHKENPEIEREYQAAIREPASSGILPVRTFFVPLAALGFHSLFNNSLSVLPLQNFLLLLVVLHQRTALWETRWKWRFSPFLLIYLLLPPVFGVFAWNVQGSKHMEEKRVFEGKAFFEKKEFPAAVTAFEQALKSNSQSLPALSGLAVVREAQNLLPEAQDFWAMLDKLAPNAFAAKYHIARLLFARGMLLEAHRWALSNLAADKSPSAYELLGRIFLAEGRGREAEETFTEGLSSVPFWIGSEVEKANSMELHLASLALDRENLIEARRLLQRITTPVSGTPEFAFLRGIFEYRSGSSSEALKCFEQARERDVSEPKYANALGFVLVESGKELDRAQALLEEAYRNFRSRNPPVLADILSVSHSLGMLYWKRNQLSKAHEMLYLAFANSPTSWGKARESRERDYQRFLLETGRVASDALIAPIARFATDSLQASGAESIQALSPASATPVATEGRAQ